MDEAAYRRMARVEQSHWWYLGMRASARALLGPRQMEALLDAGCGTGGWLAGFRTAGVRLGVDLHPVALGIASARLPGVLARASVTALPFTDACFDVVSAIDVLYHLGVSSDRAALAELARVVRPGGRVLVQVPAYDWLRSRHDSEVGTRERYTATRLAERLRGAGLEPVRVTYANALLLPVAVAWRLAERLLPDRGAMDLVIPPAPVNRLARAALAVERRWLARHDLPFGLSVLALARRPPPSQEPCRE